MRLLGLLGALLLPGCLLDWDRDGLVKSEDCNDLDGEDTRQAWYRDSDLDGYGDPASEVLTCLWPVDWVPNSFDCDDEKAKYNPAADDEWYNDEDENCDGLNDFDRDRDGYVRSGDWVYAGGSAPGDGDCDDNDPAVNPGVAEIWYDAIDSNCDGQSDYDQDDDNYSSAAYGGSDCDDLNPRVNPGRSESCSDGIDTNCDGQLGTLAYFDADGDGYGDSDVFIEACTPPEGYSSEGGDCDDTDGTISPGVAELCGNGIDDNCSGGDRVCGPFGEGSLSDADARIYRDERRAQLGSTLAAPGDMDGDGRPDLLVGSHSGTAWLMSGAASGDIADVAYASFSSSTESGAGVGVSGAGDFNGDGELDLLISSSYRSRSGWAWVVPGPFSGALDLDVSSLATLLPDRPTSADVPALGAADYSGDGLSDAVFGQPTNGVVDSVVYVMAGGSSGALIGDDMHARIRADWESELGKALSTGEDFDGDGAADLLIGAPDDVSGKVYLFFGPISGDLDANDADTLFWDDSSQPNRLGEALAAPGDISGDGAPDFLVGAPEANNGAGAVYIVGGFNGAVYDVSLFPRIDGAAADGQLGAAVSGAGDVDNDGQTDIIVGAPQAGVGSDRSGTVYVFRGPLTATIDATAAAGSFAGADPQWRGGTALAAPGDMNGDGVPDIAVSAIGADVPSPRGGEVYLFFGAD